MKNPKETVREEKYSMTLVKNSKADFIQDDRCGVLWQGELGSTRNTVAKWEFVAKEGGGVSGWEITKRKHRE